jgi:ribosomal protein L23
VLTTHIKGKTKRVGKRRAEKAISSIKKAVVFLKPGQKISLFELSE